MVARVAALGLILLAACSPTPTARATPVGSASASPPAHSASPSPAATASPSTQSRPHVFVIVLENRSYSQAITMSYIAQLASDYGLATNYHGVSHPSLPNYLALTSGSTYGITDDGWHSLPAGGFGAQLTTAGIDWRAYMEGMTKGCYDSPYPYVLKHNPFGYYGGTCPKQVVSFSNFSSDMSGTVPNFVWITPNSCNDGHDCSNATVNSWLQQTVPVILNTTAWKQGGVLFITYDEGEDSANSVLTLVIHPRPIIHRSSQPYDHYSLLATIEDTLGVPRLGRAAQASPMSSLMASWPLLP